MLIQDAVIKRHKGEVIKSTETINFYYDQYSYFLKITSEKPRSSQVIAFHNALLLFICWAKLI